VISVTSPQGTSLPVCGTPLSPDLALNLATHGEDRLAVVHGNRAFLDQRPVAIFQSHWRATDLLIDHIAVDRADDDYPHRVQSLYCHRVTTSPACSSKLATEPTSDYQTILLVAFVRALAAHSLVGMTCFHSALVGFAFSGVGDIGQLCFAESWSARVAASPIAADNRLSTTSDSIAMALKPPPARSHWQPLLLLLTPRIVEVAASFDGKCIAARLWRPAISCFSATGANNYDAKTTSSGLSVGAAASG
jgi:hypothetical protein